MEQYDKKGSKAVTKMHKRKKRQVNQIIHTVTKEVIEEAKRNNVGTIVVGDIKNIRKDKHWNKKASQNCTHGNLLSSLPSLNTKQNKLAYVLRR
jgi:Probable transposase.